MKIKSFDSFLNEEVVNEAAIQVNDMQFQGAHKKKPSGDGNWAFSKFKNYDPDIHAKEDLFQKQGKYTEVKKAAIKYFSGKDTSTIYLQS